MTPMTTREMTPWHYHDFRMLVSGDRWIVQGIQRVGVPRIASPDDVTKDSAAVSATVMGGSGRRLSGSVRTFSNSAIT